MLPILSRQLKFPQKSLEWLKARHNMLTSSEIATALNCNQYETRLELLKRKCKAFAEVINESSASTKWGEKYEPHARNIFTSITGFNVHECSLVTHEKYPWIGASPDGVLENGELLEIKCPHHRVITQGIIPYYYYIQAQIQMEVCNAERVHFFQCQFVENPPIQYNHYGDNWGLKHYTLDIITRDRTWFSNAFPQLENFWQQVLHYRGAGFNKLMEHEGTKPVYFNLQNNTLLMPEDDLFELPPPVIPVVNPRADNINSDMSMVQSSPSSQLDYNPPAHNTRGRKRKRCEMSPILEPSSQPELPRDWNEWVVATAMCNYMMDDTILDWFKEHGKTQLPKRRKKESLVMPSNNMQAYGIRAKGILFEKEVMSCLFKKFKKHIVEIADPCQVRQTEKFHETVEAMRKGTPIIYQAVLHNNENKTYGVPDLLVRSDWINKLINDEAIHGSDKHIGCDFSDNWHYRVIDIKFTTLNLRSDGTYLLNSGSVPAYKAQLYVYNQAIANIQGYNPNEAYILGRKWQYTSKKQTYSGDGWFDRLGVVNFELTDASFKSKTEDAMTWVRKVRSDGHTWSINPPSLPELYPNMKNYNDTPWRGRKKEIAEDIGELTNLWYCGVKNRRLAHEQGITSWRDPRCNADTLGIKGQITAPVVNAILTVNRGNEDYTPTKLNEHFPRYKVEFFIDFETVNGLVGDISSDNPISSTDTYLFMIGVGWRINKRGQRSKWVYKTFTTNRIDFASTEERDIFIEFHRYIEEILGKYHAHNNFMIYHWSSAEPNIYENTCGKYGLDPEGFDGHWYDLLPIFKKTPIVIKGAFNFSLKSIAKALHAHGYISTCWSENSHVPDGASAMLYALECSKNAQERDISMVELPLMQQIIKYNEIDCKVLLEILSFLRNEMSQ